MRGSIKWSFLLCRFADSGVPSRSLSFYQDMIINSGTGGLNDYWKDVSNGKANLDGSVVKGWYTMTSTSEQARQELAKPDRDREKFLRECIAAAKASNTDPYTVPSDHNVAVITEPGVDMWGRFGASFFPNDVNLAGLAHEIGHGLGLSHSFSDDPNYKNSEWAQVGEYDNYWDIMSYPNILSTKTSNFGSGGPGLNAYHMDRLGWIPINRILTVGADGMSSKVITIAALSHPEVTGYQLVRIPFDTADPFHYYTVEFRKNEKWDYGFLTSRVLIHEIKSPNYQSYLLRERTSSRTPLQSLSANGVEITVNNIASSAHQATITVTFKTDIVSRCLQGYVLREVDTTDTVCVTEITKSQIKIDNALGLLRRTATGACKSGFVWREAVQKDRVCVTGTVRAQTQTDNQLANSRKNPTRLTTGPNTCQSGYVWREADQNDYVCVTGDVRAQVQSDNAQASNRRNPSGPYGPNTCIQGYVWREAYAGDYVCVTGAVRTQARNDNAQAQNRLLKP